MNAPDGASRSFLRACLAVALPVFIVVAAAVSHVGTAFAAFSSPAHHTTSDGDVLFYAPFILAWFTCFVTAPPLMYGVAILFLPWAVLSLLLVFVAPPFGIPGIIVIGLWYRYFLDVRRSSRTSVPLPRYLQ